MSRTILLVDPGSEALAKIGKFLEEFGFSVQTAASRAEALDQVKVFDPGLLVVSLTLPDGDAFMLLDEVRQFFQSKAPLLITAPPPQIRETRRSPHGLAPQGWIPAPIDQMEFYNYINQWLGVEIDQDAAPAPAERQAPAGRRLAALRPPAEPPRAPAGPAWRARRSAAAPAAGAPDAVLGNLRRSPPARLLPRLAKERETGVLQLNRSPYKIHLHFQDGLIVNVQSNYIPELSLGVMLAKRGDITTGELAGARRRWEREGGLFGQVLLAMDLVAAEELDSGLREHWSRKLLSLFHWHWDQGTYVFARGAAAVEPQRGWRQPVADLVVEGIEQYYDRERALKLLGRKRLRQRVTVANVAPRFGGAADGALWQPILNAIRAGGALTAAQTLSEMNETDFLKAVCALSVLDALVFHGE